MKALLLLLAPVIVAADGQWAALSQGRTCEAAARSLGVVYKDRPPARASLAFDAGGPRRGQFAARLSRVPRPGATTIANAYEAFLADLPDLAASARQDSEELTYTDRLKHIETFLETLA